MASKMMVHGPPDTREIITSPVIPRKWRLMSVFIKFIYVSL